MRHHLSGISAGETYRRRRRYFSGAASLHGASQDRTPRQCHLQRLPDNLLATCVHGSVALELLGLNPGEYVTLHNGFHFRVLRGAVEFNGHVYTAHRRAYSKVLIPPWSAAERMLALCSGDDDKGQADCSRKDEHHRDCKRCGEIALVNLLGGSCCQIRERIAKGDVLMERHFNITKPHHQPLDVESDPDVKALEWYDSNSPYKARFQTVVAFVMHTSAFGSIKIRNIFSHRQCPKIIAPQITQAATKLLETCAAGDKSPVLMVHGEKSAGKSTAVIYMINYLLNHVSMVALLETDVGQPIFGPPGTISLKFVTEPITTTPHALEGNNPPEATFLIGDVKVTNPLLTMSHIRKCLDIYAKCVEDDRSVPLIINTFGWITGLGGKLLESIAETSKAAVMLRLHCKLLNGISFPSVTTHQELENAILESMAIEPETEENPSDIIPISDKVMHSQGFELTWERGRCTIVDVLSHSQIMYLIETLVEQFRNNCSGEESCSLRTWRRFQKRANVIDPSPNDLRWLRVCVLLNPSFGDAMHFPQLHQEEFFGAVGGPEFNSFVPNPKLFQTPRQLMIKVENCSFVLQVTNLLETIQEICPVIAGSIVALCKGPCDLQVTNAISEDWEFIAYVYVHYLNAEEMTLLLSHSVNQEPQELLGANIVVLCQTIGFETIPTRICSLSSYPGVGCRKKWLDDLPRQRELSTSQFFPFRRNHLLHMINVQGSGNASGNSRKNIKRHKLEAR